MPHFVPRVFSGMQPTGNLHLGNYLGAMLNWIAMQETHECIYCVVDMHAITVWQEPAELRKAIIDVTAAYLACGLDPKKSIIFNQSQVAEHAELAWILSCVARLGWLNRMTQFKEKAGKDKEAASVGLYIYPNLMAADILAYHATHVPVGEDQKQHLELARDIAIKFNNDYASAIDDGIFFPPPEPFITGPATRVMSLRDGTKKMSKSDPSDLSRLNLTDDADTIARKIRKAKTDPEALPSEAAGLKGRPEAENLVGIFAAFKGDSVDKILAQYGGGQFSSFKNDLADLAVAKLGPIGDETKRLRADPAYVESVLKDGSERARTIAAPIVRKAREIVGFIVS
ncbi:MAG: tryptophan--tRNA ligase [Rhizobiales bacterium]|nr:tryptophan--tRNA ligase [Hyphomicrobiales bacterium]MBI3672883.1 tryptophan--tRNA ligase [Hyphomicrobiales bacterium]